MDIIDVWMDRPTTQLQNVAYTVEEERKKKMNCVLQQLPSD